MPKRKMILTLGYTGIGLLGLLTLAMLFPAIHTTASATNCDPEISTEGCLVAEAAQEVGATVSTVLSLAMQNKVELEVVPKSSGTTSYAASKLAVSTNSHAGYSIYLQAAGEEGNLMGVTSNLSGVIKNTTRESVRLEQLEANSYGYALSETAVDDSTTYSHIPTTNTAIKTTTSTAVSSSDHAYGDSYYLAFGTHIDTTLPAGQYAGSVTVSAVANPVTLQSLYDITEMQQMQPEICENTKEGYTKQLVDTRDGKSYWVAKLKDGNCWMTQNLALDITEEGLKAVDTDIEEDWNQESEYPPLQVNSVKFLGSTIYPANTAATSWNLGQRTVLALPVANKACVRSGETNNAYSAISTDDLGEVCASAGFVSIASGVWSDTYSVQDGVYVLPNGQTYNGPVAVDITSKTYDAHYLVGNHYSFVAATAGTGVTDSAGEAVVNAPGSICPKGWTLPLSGSNSIDIEGSFSYLYNKSGLFGSGSTNNVLNSSAIFVSPFYITRGGSVYTPSGYLQYAGHQALYWSRTNSPKKNYAYFTMSAGASTTLNQADTRSLGQSVRCLAR